jgi:hypothetical protein
MAALSVATPSYLGAHLKLSAAPGIFLDISALSLGWLKERLGTAKELGPAPQPPKTSNSVRHRDPGAGIGAMQRSRGIMFNADVLARTGSTAFNHALLQLGPGIVHAVIQRLDLESAGQGRELLFQAREAVTALAWHVDPSCLALRRAIQMHITLSSALGKDQLQELLKRLEGVEKIPGYGWVLLYHYWADVRKMLRGQDKQANLRRIVAHIKSCECDLFAAQPALKMPAM